jgi:hypothetical protein
MVMVNQVIELAQKTGKNILILGSPRSGTHALASLLHQQLPDYKYLAEICKSTNYDYPWNEITKVLSNRKSIAHIVQSYAKIFLISKVAQIKEHNVLVTIRRRNKVKQFASWMYFKHIGFIYNFDHSKTDYIPPGSIEVSINDIESFISDQIIDDQFKTDFTVYYEDIDFTNSNFKKNHYAYPIEEVILNLDFVRSYLQDWQHA